MSLTIRRARPGEAGLVLSFVRELAEYEKLLTKWRPAKPISTRRCSASIRGCFARSRNGTASLSASRSGSSIFRPSAAAPESISKICSSARRCAARASARRCWCISPRECVANGWSRLQWAVLDWNTPSIEFYKSLGAVLMDEWTVCRIGGPALTALAQGDALMEIVLDRRGRRERRDRATAPFRGG